MKIFQVADRESVQSKVHKLVCLNCLFGLIKCGVVGFRESRHGDGRAICRDSSRWMYRNASDIITRDPKTCKQSPYQARLGHSEALVPSYPNAESTHRYLSLNWPSWQ